MLPPVKKHFRTLLIISLLGCSILKSKGQDRNAIAENVNWFYFGEKIKWNSKITSSLAFQYRSFLDREDGYHIFFSSNISVAIAPGWSAGGGFTNLNINRDIGGEENTLVPEIRPFQFVQFKNKSRKLDFSWRFMLEERFFRNTGEGELAPGFNSNLRFRGRAMFLYELFRISDDSKLSFELSSEVMLNYDGRDEINVFDQHRFILQLHYKLGPVKLSSGYNNWYVQTRSGALQNRHTFLVGITHSLDFSK